MCGINGPVAIKISHNFSCLCSRYQGFSLHFSIRIIFRMKFNHQYLLIYCTLPVLSFVVAWHACSEGLLYKASGLHVHHLARCPLTNFTRLYGCFGHLLFPHVRLPPGSRSVCGLPVVHHSPSTQQHPAHGTVRTNSPVNIATR